MGSRLRNRRAVEARLGGFVQAVVVPEGLVAAILDGEVDENYLAALTALDAKLAFLTSDETARAAFAARDLLPALEKLRMKALVKARLGLGRGRRRMGGRAEWRWRCGPGSAARRPQAPGPALSARGWCSNSTSPLPFHFSKP